MKFFKEKSNGRDPFALNSTTDRKVRMGKNLSFDEAFLDAQAEDPRVLDDEREHLNYRFLFVILLTCFAVLFFRLFFLQMVRGGEYRELAEGNKLRVQYILAPRGLILDRYGKTIAGNTPSFELVVVPSDLPKNEFDFQEELILVSQIIERSPGEIQEMIGKMDRNSYSSYTLLENITKEQALILISRSGELSGFSIQDNAIRDYKDSNVFAHVIGHTGKVTQDELSGHQDYLLNDYIGKSGLELQYEQFLRGIPGKRQVEVDAQGNLKKTLAEVPATLGLNLKLNIDYELQKKIYDSLLEVMGRGKAKKAAAVATDPQTGRVLALVSLPSFDNNMFARGIKTDEYNQLLNDPNFPMINRVVDGTYPPGSTVKPMLATAALTEGVVKPNTKILDDGVIRVGSYTFYGYDHSGLGLMDIYSAIAKSSDIYFYTVGGGNAKTNFTGMGPEKVAEWYRKFYLGQKSGIDLPYEKTGLVPDPQWKLATRDEKWYLGDTYHFSIGQGDLLVTPLQVNNWTATIANGGRIMQPFILDEVVDNAGRAIKEIQPKVLTDHVASPEIIKIVQDGMRQTVTLGSARSLNTLPIEISGKTGSAQFDAKDLSRLHAWFTSYAPSSNPQIALTILVESGGEGSSVSVPVAKMVYEWWAQNRYNK
jgi:penicillin-binding protein 2